MRIRDLVAAVLMCTFLTAGVVSAQPLGSFRWQQQPYCNVITVNVTQSGVFQLDGIDDQCGAATSAAVVGMAFLNQNGSVGLGMTLVATPGGTPLHIDASISVATGSGMWRDSSGATGVFALTPGAGTGGSARPLPRALFQRASRRAARRSPTSRRPWGPTMPRQRATWMAPTQRKPTRRTSRRRLPPPRPTCGWR